jgi:thiol:disulfide interchange protein DsbD
MQANPLPRLWSLCLSLLLAALSPALQAVTLLPSQTAAGAVRTDHVTAELVAERDAVQPGQSLQIGLRLQHIPHWHTYWRNPGDSGLPTTIEWQLPAGASVGDIEWPAPKRLPLGPLVNYGYEGELLLPLRFTAPADARPGQELRLQAEARWLVCRDVCIPEDATLTLTLPVVGAGVTPGRTPWTADFQQAAAVRTQPLQGWTAQLQHAGRELLLTLESEAPQPAGAALPVIEVFPYAEQVVEPAVHELYRTPRGYALRMRLMADAAPPDALAGIAVAQQSGGTVWGSGGSASAEFSAPRREVASIALPDGAALLAGTAPALVADAVAGPTTSLWMALLLAFAGGMVLNLMPCVFPVLSIKLLGLAKQSPGSGALRAHALAYGGGVLLSFLALAAGLIALQAAGKAVGWGFQLQEPGMVALLALLFFGIGLNLMGVFELGNLLPQRLAGWRARRPAADAFACGVLAVVAASPCTAPFMGAALGYALTQSSAVALAVFAALGLGMALPYMALTVAPGWRRHLPKPGRWMERLKQGLAFPMFATAVWLLWVLGQQAGVGAMARLLMALVGLAMLLWLAHAGALRGALGKGLASAALAALLVWSWPEEPPAAPVAAAGGRGTAAAEAGWLPYDEQALARFAAEGRPVFVDFTAAWCVSCQVNKRLVLDSDEARQAFERADVALMRADWTRRDAVITQALARLGRNGVPVYVLLRPGREPLLLPEILSQRSLREALASLQP